MKNVWVFVFVLLIVSVLGLYLFTFQVRETQIVVVTTFGKPTRTLYEPGIYFKWPRPINDFKPGQFTMVGLTPDSVRCPHAETEEVKRKPTDPIIRRAYSICSDPQNSDTYEIYLSLVKKGELTSRMFILKEGDRVWNSGKPTGFFTTERIPETKGQAKDI